LPFVEKGKWRGIQAFYEEGSRFSLSLSLPLPAVGGIQKVKMVGVTECVLNISN